jgi:dTDP-4-dehydrorhamnose 3,5-epimerase
VLRRIETELAGVFILERDTFSDDRGFFYRIYCKDDLADLTPKPLTQINYSFTRAARTVRGLHFQTPPKAENKLVQCIQGKIFDVIVDLRAGSPTFLKWCAVELSGDNRRSVWIPEGCAHGFQALTGDCAMIYGHTAAFAKENEGTVRFDDPRIGVKWPHTPRHLSAKDLGAPLLTADYKGMKT